MRENKQRTAALSAAYAILRVAILAGIFWFMCTKVFYVAQMHGMDMNPALQDGDLLIAYRQIGQLRYGDILLCRAEGKVVCLRVIARSGDTVTLEENGRVLINGAQEGMQVFYPTFGSEEEPYYVVPEGELFLLGDGRLEAKDSRSFGYISQGDVLGKVFTVIRRHNL